MSIVVTPQDQDFELRASRRSRSEFLQTLLTVVPMMLADGVSIVITMAFAQVLLALVFTDVHYALTRQLLPLLAIAAVTYTIGGAYRICGLHPSQELRRITLLDNTALLLLLLANLLFSESSTPYELSLVCLTLVLLNLIHPGVRLVSRTLLSTQPWWGWSVVVVGHREHAQRVLKHIQKNAELAMRPVKLLTSEEFSTASTTPEKEQLARDTVAQSHASIVVMAVENADPTSYCSDIDFWSTQSKDVIIVPANFQWPTLWTEARDIGGIMGLHARAKLLSHWRLLSKRILDIGLILLFSPVLLPIFLLIAALVRLNSAGPIFFGHKRIGRSGRTFTAWKFRSMVPNANEALEKYLNDHPELRVEWERDHKLKDDPRIIPGIGNIIRKFSLDELPQLWNVLRGDMSLVGPRPIVDSEIEKYCDVFPLYLKVTPGITGLWQVSGRNNTTYQERITLDAFYVRNWSPWLDLYILARTIKTVLLREGAY
ncbi:undecaprenyl-phosphate galactose phosphotransferase WbaP [Blastopirellula marina]|uniref:Undecaprenyl-phosphate galactose phosphotransferase WbaP n=1 Tax=Blastopirellula marina TaxID=124 RepID=A0A2S8F0M8_9BACT|nr:MULTISPECIES: undecaprenyl-phosphate galactose phosphotransferase WbaP [Pirellulaceae]PQO25697.1 undecaprenyl-phosphate galactose phosphotransferase WbaP [Blastopirellula marina]RCS43380.1 undecaprenyl-phosphate galactose phosphotransferase WbaP [Bremerella cremea]